MTRLLVLAALVCTVTQAFVPRTSLKTWTSQATRQSPRAALSRENAIKSDLTAETTRPAPFRARAMDGMRAASTDWYRFVIPAFGTAVSAFIILVKLNAQTPASFLRCTSALSGALSVWHRLATPVIHLTRWSQTAAVMLIGNSYVFLHCWMASVFQFGVMFSTVFQALSNLCLRLLHAPCNVKSTQKAVCLINTDP